MQNKDEKLLDHFKKQSERLLQDSYARDRIEFKEKLKEHELVFGKTDSNLFKNINYKELYQSATFYAEKNYYDLPICNRVGFDNTERRLIWTESYGNKYYAIENDYVLALYQIGSDIRWIDTKQKITQGIANVIRHKAWDRFKYFSYPRAYVLARKETKIKDNRIFTSNKKSIKPYFDELSIIDFLIDYVKKDYSKLQGITNRPKTMTNIAKLQEKINLKSSGEYRELYSHMLTELSKKISIIDYLIKYVQTK